MFVGLLPCDRVERIGIEGIFVQPPHWRKPPFGIRPFFAQAPKRLSLSPAGLFTDHPVKGG